MPTLNHHIVSATDSEASARFYSEILGFDPAMRLGHFGSGGTEAEHVHPLVATPIEPDLQAAYPPNRH